MDQRALVARAQGGDRDAFAQLVTNTADRLYALAWRILRDVELAHDAVQSAQLAAWRDLRSLRDPERFDAWQYRLLVRACYVEARHRRRQAVLRPLERSPERGLDPARQLADHDQLERAFRRLTPEQRAVVVLRFYADLPLTEVAAAVGVPAGTARSRLHYALERLREAIVASGDPAAEELA
ncbi:MAG TPA: sigma-70 family RNA polymerase sigma factor [Candidatus Limnocylindrales bacterium]|nr:sigma-70 family RNA polymerase sigma factor [Candidatus Limnocylindrales bacterium]